MRSGAAATLGSGESSGGFQSLPVQMADKLPEGSGADSRQGSGSFRRVPAQMADEVPEGSGADSKQGSGEFWSCWG